MLDMTFEDAKACVVALWRYEIGELSDFSLDQGIAAPSVASDTSALLLPAPVVLLAAPLAWLLVRRASVSPKTLWPSWSTRAAAALAACSQPWQRVLTWWRSDRGASGPASR